MVAFLYTIGALTFNPGFRGILVVAVGVGVLMGTVFVLLSTNIGIRLGAGIAITGLLGWMFLMGVIWAMYGIGYKGPAPKWKVKELSYDTAKAELPVAHQIPNADKLPTAQSFLDKRADLKKAFANQPKPPSLGDLLSVDPKLTSQIDTGKAWELLSVSDAQTGDAVATATAFLGADQQNICPTTSDCVELNAYTHGGKPKRSDNSVVGRAWYKVKSALTFKNPNHYAVVEFRKAIPQATLPGAAPPIPIADKGSPVISVIMERDIGSKRLPSIVLAVLMGVAFLTCCSILHQREKLSARNRAEG